jgi:hypothetical protein
MDRSKAVARARKLLALARSPEASEAESARRAADKLMREQGLTDSEVSGSDICEISLGSRGFDALWRFELVTSVARHCGAEAVASRAKGRRRIRIVGDARDVDRARSLYEGALRLVERVERMMADEIAGEIERTYVEESFWQDVTEGEAARSVRAGIAAAICMILSGPRRGRSADRGLVRSVRGRSAEEVRARYAPREVQSEGPASWRLYELGLRFALGRLEVIDGEVVPRSVSFGG